MESLSSPGPQDEYRIASVAEVAEAKAQAASDVETACEGRSRNEVLAVARQYVQSYKHLLHEGYHRQGWLAELPELINETFPDADPETRRQLAIEIIDLIRERLGTIKAPFSHKEFVAALERQDKVVDQLAARLSGDDLNDLERQATKLIRKFPDNYERFRAYWLAEWLAKGILFLADGPSAAMLASDAA